MNLRRFLSTMVAIVLIALTGAFQSSMASGLRASVNTTHVALGDSFVLTLSIADAGPASRPDLSPLAQDFRILGTSRQSQTSVINGRRTDSFSWLISLSPNEKGSFTIPSIVAGSYSSDPLTIEVIEAEAMPTAATADGSISIDVSVDPGTYYVQQEIPLTVRIHDAIGIREARLAEPSGADFVLKKTGDDQISRATRNGREVTVVERHYFLTPQKSGNLRIPPLTLTTTVEDRSSMSSMISGMELPGAMGGIPFGESLFRDLFNRGREVTVRSAPVELDVKSRPTSDRALVPARQARSIE